MQVDKSFLDFIILEESISYSQSPYIRIGPEKPLRPCKIVECSQDFERGSHFVDNESVEVSRGVWAPCKILKSRVSVMSFPACIRGEPWLDPPLATSLIYLLLIKIYLIS